MITGVGIKYVEMKRDKDGMPSGMGINTNAKLDTLRVEKGLILMDFEYTLTYDDGIGSLKIGGVVAAKEDKPEEFVKECKRSKRFPEQFYKDVINAINFTCSINGTFFVRVSGFMPLIDIPVPPTEEMKPAPAEPTAGKSAARRKAS
ncbi:MAG: hypothetical protein QW112_02585 [Candidatus Micrarchaeia archaeon]